MPASAPVTIVFTDLLGGAQLEEDVGEDAALDLRRRHFRVVRDAVAAVHGHDLKNLGDGLVATFTSAVDGLSAAVDIQRSASRNNLQVRVGVNVGEAIHSEEDYLGVPVNLARRLCERAEAGQVLTLRLVRELVGSRGEFDFRDLGAQRLKAIAEPVAVCEVAWRVPDLEPTVLPRELEGPTRTRFVGRQTELRRLQELWRATTAGSKQLVLVSGEPGIGKSRLVREFASSSEVAGATVLFGGCDEESVVPYQPFVEALRGYMERSSRSRVRATLGRGSGELARLVPELGDQLPGPPVTLLDEPDADRFRLFEAVGGLLRDLSQSAPVLLILDDLHWADRPALLALRHVVAAVEAAPLMVLATYRDVEVDRRHPLTQVLADLRREAGVERVPLTGLSHAEIRAFLELVPQAGLEGHLDALIEALHRDTEGNPLFLEEIVRHLAESGRLADATGIEELGVPESIRDIVARRVGALSSECGRVLATASVLGQSFELRELQVVAGVPMTELLETLADATEAQVILEEPRQPGHFRFAHALVRQVLYEDLGATRRLRVHQRAAEAIEELYTGQLDPHLARLAHHFLAAAPAGDPAKAIGYALMAGSRAIRGLAPEEAVALLGRALEVMNGAGIDGARRCRLLLALGEAQARAGDAEVARATFATAADVARRLSTEELAESDSTAPELYAEAAIGFGGYAPFGDAGVLDTPLVSMLETALDDLDDAPSPARCRILARLAVEFYWEESDEVRRELSRKAVDMARALGDRGLLAYALNSRILALWGPDSVEERLELAAEMAGIAEQADDDLLATAHNYRASALLELGRPEEAFEEVAALDRIATASRLPSAQWQATSYQAVQAVLEGRLDDAEQVAARCFVLGQKVRPQVAMQAFSGHMYSVRFNQGRLDELEGSVTGFTEDEGGLPIWRAVLAHLHKHLGHTEEARAAFQYFAERDFAGIPKNTTYLSAIATLAEVCPTAGDATAAARLYDLLLPYSGRAVVLGWASVVQGAVDHHLGVLAVAMGNWDAAANHLDAATALHARLGAHHWQGRTELAYARMLMGRDGPGDAGRAREHLATARAKADELGLLYILEEVRELGSRPAGDAPPPRVSR